MPRRRQYSGQTKRLLQRHPYLQKIVNNAMPGWWSGTTFVPNIKVERGDADLLFRRADDVLGGGQTLWDRGYPGLEGVRNECYYPVSTGGVLGLQRHWEDDYEHYVRDLFWHPLRDWVLDDTDEDERHHGQDAFEVVDSIVWVTKEAWYREGGSDPRSGVKPSRIDLLITIFQKPKTGWREAYWSADPLRNVTLHGENLLAGYLPNDPFRVVLRDQLGRLAIEFQQRVWEAGLGTFMDRSDSSGMAGKFGSVSVLTFIGAGRLVVQFGRGATTLTLGGLSDPGKNPRLGFRGVEGTMSEAEALVRDAITFWESADAETRDAVHRDNPNVRLGFLG